MVKQISDNEIYLLIKYIKSVLWRVAKHLSYKQDARCIKVKGASDSTSFEVILKCQTAWTWAHHFLVEWLDAG